MSLDTSTIQNNTSDLVEIETICFNCKNELTDRNPQLLSCLHSICEECLKSSTTGLRMYINYLFYRVYVIYIFTFVIAIYINDFCLQYLNLLDSKIQF